MPKSKIDQMVERGQLTDVRDEGTDIENAFMLYATFCGDVERTAHALGVPPVHIIDLARQHSWNEKLRGIIELKKSGKPGDVERAVNRALNFVQAHRLRRVLERVVAHLCQMSLQDMDDLLMVMSFDAEGERIKRLNTRPLADIAAALEKCHALTYLALNDSTTERRARDDRPDSETSGGELHAKIAAALSKTANVSKELADEQNATCPLPVSG